MTTDLSDNSELDADDYDFPWDEFAPEPDESGPEGDVALEAVDADFEWDALDDEEAELDWEAALVDDRDLEAGGTSDANRLDAAFERMEEKVRRASLESESEPEPEPAQSVTEPEPEYDPAQSVTEPEPEYDPAEWLLEPEPESAQSLLEPEPEPEPAPAQSLSEPEPEYDPAEWLLEPEPESTQSLLEPEREPEPMLSFVESALESELAPPLSEPEAWPLRAPSHARTDDGVDRKPASRILKAAAVMIGILLALIVASVVVRPTHSPSSAGPTTPHHPTPPTHPISATSSADATRAQSATNEVDSATTAARSAVTSLSQFPTPANVATLINPYVNSLQLYETFLAGATMAPSARPAADAALAEVRQDISFLETIDGLPPIQLGAFLHQFMADSTQLQTTLSTLEQELR